MPGLSVSIASSRAVRNYWLYCQFCSRRKRVKNDNAMIQSLSPSNYANTIAHQAQSPPLGSGSRMRRVRQAIAAIQTAQHSNIVPNPLAVPAFLRNRIGWTWASVQADLRLFVSSEGEYCQLMQGLLAFVETDVVGTAIHPRHGSGILTGLPLTSGWRRRLFVCPESDQLLWIGG